jgi:2-amino-4-hydroxy-6-hydroxymethyldihydropteridine diphosphokinase
MTPDTENAQPACSRAVLALGSNLPPRAGWLDLALAVFGRAGLEILTATPRWNTVAIGTMPQPDFLNQLVLLRGERTGLGWLDLAKEAEDQAGRRRRPCHGPRTLDVDVILIEDEDWDLPELAVPHPGLLTRPYLLLGASQLAPDWRHPGEGGSISELAQRHLSGSWAPTWPRARAAADPPGRGLP